MNRKSLFASVRNSFRNKWLFLVLFGVLFVMARGVYATAIKHEGDILSGPLVFGGYAFPPFVANVLEYASFYLSFPILVLGTIITVCSYDNKTEIMRRVHIGSLESVISPIVSAALCAVCYTLLAIIIGCVSQVVWNLLNPQQVYLLPSDFLLNLLGKAFVCFFITFFITLIGVFGASVSRNSYAALVFDIIIYFVLINLTVISYIDVLAFQDAIIPVFIYPQYTIPVSTFRIVVVCLLLTAFLLVGIISFSLRPVYDFNRRSDRRRLARK